MSHRCNVALLTSIALSCVGAAQSAAADPISYNFSGYGTLGMVSSSEHQADYNSEWQQPNGAGHARNWSPDVDSRLGAQLSANFNDQWSAVVQVLAQHQADNSYAPRLEWANVQYQPTPDFSIRVGRVVMPNLLMSLSRKVGYTVPFVRTPVILYMTQPITSSDGVDASYTLHAGALKNTITVNVGEKNFPVNSGPAAGSTLDFKDIRSITDVLSSGAWTVQLSHMQGNIIDARNFVRLPTTSLVFGVMYDPGNWFATSEVLRFRNDVAGDVRGWYVAAGYRFGDLTPYLTYADRGLRSQTPFSVIPPAKSAAAGLRWDFRRNMDFKLEYERNSMPSNSSGTLINLQPGYLAGGKFHTVSATVDFVF